MSDILKKPKEWEKETGINIIDQDGWRFDHEKYMAKDFDISISEKEFHYRAMNSTIFLKAPFKLAAENE